MGYSSRMRGVAMSAPTTSATTNIGTELGCMPANEFVRDRAIAAAGLAKLVDDVKK